MHRSSNAGDVNSPALSMRMVLIGEFRNCARSLMIWVSSRAMTKLRADISDTWDHFVDEQIMTRKKRKGPLGGSMGPHTSTFNCSRKAGILFNVFDNEGLNTNLPCEHARQVSFIEVGCTMVGMPLVSFIICWYIKVPGWPRR